MLSQTSPRYGIFWSILGNLDQSQIPGALYRFKAALDSQLLINMFDVRPGGTDRNKKRLGDLVAGHLRIQEP